MFGYQYRKFLNELALLTNGEVKKTNSFSGFVYYWFPGFLFKKDNLKIEFGRKGWDKHRGDDSTTCFYMTTNNKYLIEEITNFILKDRDDVIKVFVYSNMKDKIKRAEEFYNIDKKKAEKEINKINKLRANHYKHYTDREWQNHENYDICINSDTLGVEKSADFICKLVNEKEELLV